MCQLSTTRYYYHIFDMVLFYAHNFIWINDSRALNHGEGEKLSMVFKLVASHKRKVSNLFPATFLGRESKEAALRQNFRKSLNGRLVRILPNDFCSCSSGRYWTWLTGSRSMNMVAMDRDDRGAESKRTKNFPSACSRRTLRRGILRNGVQLPVAKGLEVHTS